MGHMKECGKRSTVLADGLAGAILMQRERQAAPDRGFSSCPAPKDSAGMLFYLSGYMSKADPEASELFKQMGEMVRAELSAAKGVAA